jgi:hypothetical protein
VLWKIYDESLYELKRLDNKKYVIFLSNLKKLLESLQSIKCRTFFSFEKWRYDSREVDTVVVIEGYCDNCEQYTSGSAYFKDYLRNYFSGNKISELCPNCNIGKLDFESIIEDK